MQTLIDAYWTALYEVAGYAFDTVENYVCCLEKYFDYAKNDLKIDPLKAGPKHLLNWMIYLKELGLGRSRLTHHKSALNHCFALLVRLGRRQHNPAEALFTIRKKKSEMNQPVSEETALKLLRSLKRDTWIDERNFMIISIFWTLGLRIGELTALKVGSFEPEHDPENQIGLLRVRGKGNKERALFVVDKLYQNLVNYLAHPDSPKHPSQPMFPIHTDKNKAVSPNPAKRDRESSKRSR